MPRSEASSGYAGDVSVGSEDSSSEDSGDGIKPGFTISVTEQRTRSLHSTRRRKRSTTQSKGIAPSPIHPDIDISLTHHMTYSDLMGLRPPLNNAAASSSIQPTEALSRLLFGYFALIRTHAANSEVKNKGATMEGKSLDTASMQSDAKQAPKRSARCSATKEDKKLPSKRNPSKTLQTENEHEIQGSAKPQIIAANPTLVRDAPTTFSSEHLFLEDALALTKTPRVLIEAIRPYRVVHANAAFSKSVIGTSNNIQRWIDQQNSQRKSKAYRTLEKALRDMVPDLDVPLTVYPVLGSETISHYLVETIYSNPKKRRRGKLEEPSRTIG